MSLIVHCGGWRATRADLQSVPVPEATESYVPVPYTRLLEEVHLHLPRFGLKVVREDYALARGGNQMFGVLGCENGANHRSYGLVIGIRSSYDHSLAVELVAGSRVFCCDNLAFHGEADAHVRRKSTLNVFRDLPEMIYKMLTAVSVMKERMHAEIGAWQQFRMDAQLAHHLMVEGIRRDVLPASLLPKLLELWDKPPHEEFQPRTAWSLFNAFTELGKTRAPRQQMGESLRLTRLFREELAPSHEL